MNNVLLINCLVQELQNNPALLTDSVIGSLADKIANTIITLSALVDPNSPVWDFLYGQMILLEGKLIEVTGSVTDGTLSTLQTMGGWSKKMVYDFVPDLKNIFDIQKECIYLSSSLMVPNTSVVQQICMDEHYNTLPTYIKVYYSIKQVYVRGV